MNRLLLCAGLAAALSGCGGGSSGDTTTSTSIAGVYVGSVGTSGNTVGYADVVLQGGEFFAMYSQPGTTKMAGVINGQFHQNGNNVVATFADYASGSIATGSYSGTVVAGSSLNGIFTEGTNTTPVDLTFGLNAGATPPLSSIAGEWYYTDAAGNTGQMYVPYGNGSSTSVSMSGTHGCSYDGTVAPTKGGYFLSLTQNVANAGVCWQNVSNLPALSGVIYYDGATLVGAAIASDQTGALVFSATTVPLTPDASS